ncbi:hypothetical protein [Mangrovibacterium diazotrophicum]|nr:hypothetical protein [Mangrovibacterium diazotrophicum]
MTRKGSCINFGNCSKADLKETIELGVTEDFVCPECDSELTEMVGKSKGGKKKMPLIIGGVALVLVLAGGGLIYALSGDETDEFEDLAALASTEQVQQVEETPPVAVAEESAPVPEASKQVAPSAPVNNSSLDLGFGTYKGELKDGKANGMGTMYYSERHLISKRDRQERYAEAGDYIVGEFYGGELVQGKLFDSENVQKQTLILGRPH